MAKKASRKKTPSPRRQAPPAGRFERHRPLLERLLFVVALLGILTAVHLFIQQGRGFDRGCLGFSAPGTASATFDCEVVTESSAGKLFGVSNAVWGFLFYVVIASLTAALALWKAAPLVVLRQARAGLVGLGLLYSLYLSYVQYFELGELCALCLISASLVVVLALLTALYLFQKVEPTHERPEAPAPAVGVRFYGGLAALALVFVAADFAYFGMLEKAAVAQEPAPPVAEARNIDVEATCLFDESKPVFANFEMLVFPEDPFKGSADAPVTIIEYFDPNCPHCKTAYPILQTVAATSPEKARVVYKPVAIIGQQSVVQVAALYAAAEAGKFFEMLELQFANQQPSQGNSLEELRRFARQIGMDDDEMARQIRSGAYRNAMQRDTRIFRELGFSSVPAIIFDGHTVASRSRYVECFTYFIDQALPDAAPAEEAS